jgi:hypothetical protein
MRQTRMLTHLGARGTRVLNHAFKHLRGGDDRLADGVALADHYLLRRADLRADNNTLD